MTPEEKQKLTESDICDLFITPAIKDAGWDQLTQIRREYAISPGPVVVRGNMSSRNKKKSKRADYALLRETGVPIAIVEAKDNHHSVGHGMQQALGYAADLNLPSAFSSNGDAFAAHNKVPEACEDTETQFPLTAFPPPDELWRRYKKFRKIEDDEEELVLQPYHKDAYGKEPRYYQGEAINRTIEAIAKGQKRLLLVMATGTGKTYTTFQIIWRLWKARQAKRILFLVDRNILADQTLVNDFKPFGSVMTKIKNQVINESTGATYKGSSHLTIELLFHDAPGLDTHFAANNERPDKFKRFVGQKTTFAEDIVPNLDAEHFKAFEPLFASIKSKCPTPAAP